MKKFSFLSAIIFFIGASLCISCGYLISNVVVTSSLFNFSDAISLERQTIYAISMDKNINKEPLLALKPALQQQNGAGFVYEAEENFYLIASLYDNINDAELVKNNLKAKGVDSEILSINLPSTRIEGYFSNEEKTILSNCLKAKYNIFKSLYEVAISLDTGIFDQTKSKLECNNIFSAHISTKTNLETFFKEGNNSSIISLKQELSFIDDTLSNLINENYENASQTFSSLIKQSYCKILLK